MRNLKHLETDAETLGSRILYIIGMTAVFLVLFFGACWVFSSIIDPCLEMLESLADHAIRVGKAVIKILLVSFLLFAIYMVIVESQRE